MLSRLRPAFSDALTLFLIPALAAMLPWRMGFAWLKRLAHKPWLYRESVDPAWAAALPYCNERDETDWKYRFRLLRLVDHADVYLTLLRGEHWRRKYVIETGEWPRPSPCLFLTYHWGAGNWIWPSLREHGFEAHFLARRTQGRALGLTRLSQWFGRFRGWALKRIGSSGALFTGGSANELIQAFAQGRSIVGMLDLPALKPQRQLSLPLLGAEARFPTGLVHIASELSVPIALFSIDLSLSDGSRTLHIETVPAETSIDSIMRRYVAHLDDCLRKQPEFWQMWREAPGIFKKRNAG